MTILVTGCAGFIGSRVCSLLLRCGHSVVGIDNLNDYYNIRLKEYRLQELYESPHFVFVRDDINSKPSLALLFAEHNFDAVINLAARAGVRASTETPHVYLETNAGGTLNLLDLMAQYNVQQLVFASTSSLYAGASMPFSEGADVTRPISPYAATKLAAEGLVHAWHHLYGINAAILRYFTVYGPAGRPDMSPFRFIEWITRGQPVRLYGDGTQCRDFTYVDDIAAGTVAALGIKGFEVINLGGGRSPMSINEMIAYIEQVTGREAIRERLPASALDLASTFADITKAKSLLDWEPLTVPVEGFQRTINWHLENRRLIETMDNQ